MPICPGCGKQIEYLICRETGIRSSIFDGDYGSFEYDPDGDALIYECPGCHHEITYDENEARKFLGLKQAQDNQEVKQ